jgi:hypothetical protein
MSEFDQAQLPASAETGGNEHELFQSGFRAGNGAVVYAELRTRRDLASLRSVDSETFDDPPHIQVEAPTGRCCGVCLVSAMSHLAPHHMW